jgi:alpha-beta hydrolase superfamily lysophospholipase
MAVPARETVVLLHGLARGPLSMWPLARALRRCGYDVVNLAYPTRRQDLAGLAALVRARLAAMTPAPGRGTTLHGVGQSLGGLVRLAALLDPPPPGQAHRLVTLGSPHRGAGVAAQLLGWPAAQRFFGPVLADLTPASAARRRAIAAGSAALEVGVIAGAGRRRPLAPAVALDWRRAWRRTTDGTVELRSALGATGLFARADRLVVDVGHWHLPTSPTVIRATLAFLARGRFAGPGMLPPVAFSAVDQ